MAATEVAVVLNVDIRGRFDYTVSTDVDGRERLVVVGKQTYHFDRNTPGPVELRLAGRDEQLGLVEVDTFTGDPGTSAPRCEADFASFKPRCDLLFVGSAYAPAGRPTESCEVALRLASVDKRIRVLGSRQWSSSLSGIRLTPPAAFVQMPISYDLAFGGPEYLYNLVGVGHGTARERDLDGLAAPSLEALDDPVRAPTARHRPMALGGLGRGWLPRRTLAGTYDDHWREHIAPFLPPDFDTGYFQSAPGDQQIPYPVGGEWLTLHNLTPAGATHIRLPTRPMPVEYGRRDASRTTTEAKLDTIWIDGDAGLLTLVWRSSLALRKDLSEVAEVLFGPMSPGFYRARVEGKRFVSSARD